MSYDYTKRVWQNKDLKGGKLLVMLALADHADADGECWPGMPLLIDKTRLTDRQIRRVLNLLEEGGQIVIEERALGRGKKPHYKLFPCEKADKMSDHDTGKADILSQSTDKSGQNVRDYTEKADISDNKSGHLLHGKADISDTNYSHVRRELPIELPIEPREEEEMHAGEPLSVAWRQAYGDVEMPPKLPTSLQALVIECGMAATIHGIKASAAKKDGRNFRYIAECARNYIPPPPISNYANSTNGAYHVDIAEPEPEFMPAVHPVTHLPYSPAPPLPHDDPWAIALAELSPSLPGAAASFLTGSRMERGSDIAGLPLYLIVVEPRAAGGVEWLNKQVSAVIRRKLGSILRQRVEVEIVAAEQEPAPP